MNLFLWNETSQLIRNIPILTILKEKSADDIYEISYKPNSDINGEITELSAQETKTIIAFFKNNFFEGKDKLYVSKKQYQYGIISKDKLIPVTENQFVPNIESEVINLMFIHDLLMMNVSNNELEMIENEAGKIKFPIKFISLRESFQKEFDYYFNNFIFGLIISMVFMSFSILILYIILSSSIKLLAQEIRLLRIVGLSNKKMRYNFVFLLTTPSIISFILFIVFVNSTGISLISYDYLYLILLNLLSSVLSIWIIQKKLGGILNA